MSSDLHAEASIQNFDEQAQLNFTQARFIAVRSKAFQVAQNSCSTPVLALAPVFFSAFLTQPPRNHVQSTHARSVFTDSQALCSV